jgi:hypothetical protein
MTGYELKDHIWIFGKGPVFFLASLRTPSASGPILRPIQWTRGALSRVKSDRSVKQATSLYLVPRKNMESYLHCFYTPPCGSQTLGQLYTVFTMLVLFIYLFY